MFCIFGDHPIHGDCMKVLRDGRWSEEEASILVPGDIISIKLGDIIPADSRLLDGDPLKIDQVCVLSSYALHAWLDFLLLCWNQDVILTFCSLL